MSQWFLEALTRGPYKKSHAIRFLGREEAEACYHAAPADAPLRPDGTPNRPLSVYRVAVEYEPPRLPPVANNPGRQSLLKQLDLDGAI